jgi:hypothetical protein
MRAIEYGLVTIIGLAAAYFIATMAGTFVTQSFETAADSIREAGMHN